MVTGFVHKYVSLQSSPPLPISLYEYGLVSSFITHRYAIEVLEPGNETELLWDILLEEKGNLMGVEDERIEITRISLRKRRD